METGTSRVKRGMAEMQKGGVIMDVMNAEQAKIAEAAGATAVMALERVPSDIRAAGGVARMADPTIVEEVMKVVIDSGYGESTNRPFCRSESAGIAWALTISMRVKYLLLRMKYSISTNANLRFHSYAERKILEKRCAVFGEGASMLRTKGEPGTGNIVEAVRHMRLIQGQIRKVQSMSKDELYA